MTPAEIAFADQYQAASTEARTILQTAAAESGFSVRQTEDSWITEKFQEFDERSDAALVEICDHLGYYPMPAYTAAWATHLMVCSECVHLLAPSRDADDSCDRCSTEAPELYSAFALRGPIIMMYALCQPCALAAQQHGR